MAVPTNDFGAWVKERLAAAESDQAALSNVSKIVYPTLNRLLNSGKKGRPIRPDIETVQRIGAALAEMGVIPDAEDAMIAAGYVPEGYRVVRQSQKQTQRLGGDDWEPDVDPDYDPYDTIVEKAGYDTNELDEDSKARLRRSIHATVIGLMEQEKREKGQS